MSETINKKVLLTVLILGCFLSTLNQTLLNVALSNLMDVFSVSATTVQWLSTGFMMVNGVASSYHCLFNETLFYTPIIYQLHAVFVNRLYFLRSSTKLRHFINWSYDSSYWSRNYYALAYEHSNVYFSF